MKKLLTVMAFSVGLFANAQTGNLFKPVKEVALRTPSVPIVVSDPHFSIWSPYYNRQIKKFPTEKQNVSLKHILT